MRLPMTKPELSVLWDTNSGSVEFAIVRPVDFRCMLMSVIAVDEIGIFLTPAFVLDAVIFTTPAAQSKSPMLSKIASLILF